VKNSGELPFYVHKFGINGYECEGYGFRVLNCEGFQLEPNASRKIDIAWVLCNNGVKNLQRIGEQFGRAVDQQSKDLWFESQSKQLYFSVLYWIIYHPKYATTFTWQKMKIQKCWVQLVSSTVPHSLWVKRGGSTLFFMRRKTIFEEKKILRKTKMLLLKFYGL
jgi:hypothetical protein